MRVTRFEDLWKVFDASGLLAKQYGVQPDRKWFFTSHAIEQLSLWSQGIALDSWLKRKKRHRKQNSIFRLHELMPPYMPVLKTGDYFFGIPVVIEQHALQGAPCSIQVNIGQTHTYILFTVESEQQ